jgi:hypothetical protein
VRPISCIPQKLRVRLSAIVLVGAAMLPASGGAAIVNANPSNYRNVLASLNAGDTMVLEAGTYANGLPISSKSGTASQPIVITGPDDQSAIFTANDCCNTVQLDNVGFLEIRNLTLDGAGTNGAFGVDERGTTNDITIENLKIINYGGDQQVVGISTKGPAWNWTVRRNTIIGAGTGMYFGNSDGTAPFVSGLIEHNPVVDTIGCCIGERLSCAHAHAAGEPCDGRRRSVGDADLDHDRRRFLRREWRLGRQSGNLGFAIDRRLERDQYVRAGLLGSGRFGHPAGQRGGRGRGWLASTGWRRELRRRWRRNDALGAADPAGIGRTKTAPSLAILPGKGTIGPPAGLNAGVRDLAGTASTCTTTSSS